ncbi:MAG: J domain-containing protein [Acidimicrobiales bacterium]
MNHYEVLGVPMGADPAEIRRAPSASPVATTRTPERVRDRVALARAEARMQEINGVDGAG